MKTTYKKQKCHYTNVVHDTDTGNQIFLKRDLIVLSSI